MSDKPRDRLYDIAESQAGYFTTRQALSSGMSKTTLRHHSRPGGLYERVRRGLYRLRHFPSSPHEHVVAAWLSLRAAGAVVCDESALDLFELSDVIPDAIHLAVPRANRGCRSRPGVRLHTTQRGFGPHEVRTVDGLTVSSPERAIIDALEGGSQLDQIELAIQQALERGLTTPRRLHATARGRPQRVREFVDEVIEQGESCDIPVPRRSDVPSRTG